MISKFFIERPVLSNVIADPDDADRWRRSLQSSGGAVPRCSASDRAGDRHVIQAPEPKTVIDTVALPIEQQVNGVEDMLYMQSYSGADGAYTLTVTFKIGTDLNFAQVLVQNRVSSALSALPQAVQNQGVTGSEEINGSAVVRHPDLARMQPTTVFF